ncbi:MAG: TonB-dependent receptor [Limisphaerales bacterium]
MKSFDPQTATQRVLLPKSQNLLGAALVALLSITWSAKAQVVNTNGAGSATPSTNVTSLGETTVVGKLNEAREKITADLGASSYQIDHAQIVNQPQGQNASFNQVLLRAPGVSQDSFGQIHVRDEHANVQYRINDVILPEGIAGFGSVIDARFVDGMQLVTGTLPAQYGFRTAGIVDIHTKSGAFDQGGDVSIYGGSYDTIRPSFEYGGKQGKLNYYFTGSYDHSGLGVENPTPSSHAIHDFTDQYKGFGYMSYILDDTSRLSLMLSSAYSDFEIPNNPGQVAGTDPNGNPFPLGGKTVDSSNLNDKQTEQSYYGVLAYQKSMGDFNFQLAAFSQYSKVVFHPDVTGDLFFNGTASWINHSALAQGVQADSSYDVNDKHTIRAGGQAVATRAIQNSETTVFAISGGDAVAPPFAIPDESSKWGWMYGIYAQDEWKITPKWTVNYGARADVSEAFVQEAAFEPRINTIYKPTDKLTLHGGYAYYFTPPPLEGATQTTVAKFDDTSNAAGTDKNDPVRAERTHYFDVGFTFNIMKGLDVGIDGYYKVAQHQLDDGTFGNALIVTPFNYARGKTKGIELTANYKHEGLSLYGNFAVAQQRARTVESAQFEIDPADLAYIQNHFIYTDHDQRFTGSFGASYAHPWDKCNTTTFYSDALYGSGLRADGDVPNGAKLPSHAVWNLGAYHQYKLRHGALTVRADILNVLDETYVIRDGTGVGVGAPQFGMRRGFFGTLSYAF